MEKKTTDIIQALSHGPVQRYIQDHEHHDLKDLVLKHKLILGIPTARLIEQISTRKKAKLKLPLYYRAPGIIFPPPVNFEQSSSEVTALYKASVIGRWVNRPLTTGADLTGGFGVDTYFFSIKFDRMHYVEPDESLLEIARHNHHRLGADNIEYHATSAEDFLRSAAESFDFAYADPSRRTNENRRVHSFRDAQPDIAKIKTEVFKKTSLLVVKASPLLDLQEGMRQLGNVSKVFVVSVENDCKELLFICRKTAEGMPSIEAVNLSARDGEEAFQFSLAEERQQNITFADPLAYIYEPNASILKAGAFKSVAARFDLKKIQVNTHLYTAEHLVEGFPGRKFSVEALIKPDAAAFRKYFPDGKANVTTRNYPLSAEALKKKTGLRDGGDKFLIGCSGEKRKFLIVARRL